MVLETINGLPLYVTKLGKRYSTQAILQAPASLHSVLYTQTSQYIKRDNFQSHTSDGPVIVGLHKVKKNRLPTDSTNSQAQTGEHKNTQRIAQNIIVRSPRILDNRILKRRYAIKAETYQPNDCPAFAFLRRRVAKVSNRRILDFMRRMPRWSLRIRRDWLSRRVCLSLARWS